MLFASAVISSVLAVMISYAAALKLTHRPEVVESYRRAGVQEKWLNPLATLLLAAATGLVVGNWWPVAGIAAAAGLCGYFPVAVVSHLRNHDAANVAMPILLTVLAGAALALRLASM
ncbi:DoxX family protein [Mycolicibacterium boenickei]